MGINQLSLNFRRCRGPHTGKRIPKLLTKLHRHIKNKKNSPISKTKQEKVKILGPMSKRGWPNSDMLSKTPKNNWGNHQFLHNKSNTDKRSHFPYRKNPANKKLQK